MIPQRLEPGASSELTTAVAAKWRISCELSEGIHVLAALIPWPLQIVSGYRSPLLETQTPGGIDPKISTHCSCPATGADLQVIGWTKGDAPDHVRQIFGANAQAAGLRWGGGSRSDPRTGFPVDWNHVDLGPRVR